MPGLSPSLLLKSRRARWTLLCSCDSTLMAHRCCCPVWTAKAEKEKHTHTLLSLCCSWTTLLKVTKLNI
jgi:hypothetical protein